MATTPSSDAFRRQLEQAGAVLVLAARCGRRRSVTVCCQHLAALWSGRRPAARPSSSSRSKAYTASSPRARLQVRKLGPAAASSAHTSPSTAHWPATDGGGCSATARTGRVVVPAAAPQPRHRRRHLGHRSGSRPASARTPTRGPPAAGSAVPASIGRSGRGHGSAMLLGGGATRHMTIRDRIVGEAVALSPLSVDRRSGVGAVAERPRHHPLPVRPPPPAPARQGDRGGGDRSGGGGCWPTRCGWRWGSRSSGTGPWSATPGWCREGPPALPLLDRDRRGRAPRARPGRRGDPADLPLGDGADGRPRGGAGGRSAQRPGRAGVPRRPGSCPAAGTRCC